MKILKKLPFLFAFVITLLAASCSDIDVRPGSTGDDDDDPIIIGPGTKAAASTVSADTVSFN